MFGLCAIGLSAIIAVASPATLPPELPVGLHLPPGIAPRLLARDINGLQLDMTVKEVEALPHDKWEDLGGGQVKATIAGVRYDLEFTPLGHLFRISSSQQLGRFAPDRAFGLDVARRLAAKYGPPHFNWLPTGTADWDYAEPYITINGAKLNRGTESLNVMIGGGFGAPVSLQMKLMDFRLLRRDTELLNAQPEAKAQSAVKF